MRLLPILMITLAIVLLLRVSIVITEGPNAIATLGVATPVIAQEETKTAEAKPEASTETSEETADDTKEEDGENPENTDAADAGDTPAPTTESGLSEDAATPANFSQIEVDLLQSLSKRREELDARAESLDLRDSILKATEMRIEKKIDELKLLKGDVEALLAQYNEKEQQKIKSLVKIYENMKAKEAANIFNELDMEILLQVVDKMSERKLAPVLAKMNPERAREITIELADQRKLPDVEDLDETNPAAALP